MGFFKITCKSGQESNSFGRSPFVNNTTKTRKWHFRIKTKKNICREQNEKRQSIRRSLKQQLTRNCVFSGQHQDKDDLFFTQVLRSFAFICKCLAFLSKQLKVRRSVIFLNPYFNSEKEKFFGFQDFFLRINCLCLCLCLFYT